jgi:hypothetical protein
LDRNDEACVFSSEDFLLGLVQKFVSGRRAGVMGSGGKLSAVGKLSTKERSTSGFDERILYRTSMFIRTFSILQYLELLKQTPS